MDITYNDKAAASTFSHEDANEIKAAVNSKVDKEAGKILSSNDYTTTEKTNVVFATPATIAYTTAIPFTRMLTIITGKSLTSNDVLTIAANPIEGAGAQMVLVGDGSHAPDFTAFHQKIGDYDTTAGVKNLITMEYIGGEVWVSIKEGTAI